MTMNTTPRSAPPRHRQQGSALIVGLVLLLVITLIAVTGMRNTILQERMTGNMLDRNLAFQAAEAALRHGQMNLDPGAAAEPVDAPADPLAWEERLANGGGTAYAPPDAESFGLYAMPRYYIEAVPVPPVDALAADEALPNQDLYRITVRAQGGSPEAVVILQATFRH